MSTPQPARSPLALAALLCLSLPGWAQTAAPANATASPAATATPQQVEITGSTSPDTSTDERRRATASRITIGRDELDRMGDSSLGEVLKRLPGVTIGGTPGRGGQIRMRGMGGGYTQILLDGQRMPPGFSLDSIAPEQIDRIEIMRAPVAETGAQAIAGTINVILRADYKRKTNELRFGGGMDGQQPQGAATLTRNGQTDSLGYNLTTTVFRGSQHNSSDTHTLHTGADGQPTLDQTQHSDSTDHRSGLFANGRLSFKLGGTDTLDLQPFFNTVRVRSSGATALSQAVNSEDPAGGYLPAYTQADIQGRSHWQMGRLAGSYNTTSASGGKLLLRFGGMRSDSGSHTERSENGGRVALEPSQPRSKVTDVSARDTSLDNSGKFSQLIADRHSASAGWELQAGRRADRSATLLNGVADPSDSSFGDTLQASVRRVAVYGQDEWDWSKQLSFYVGARWEGIQTRADADSGPVSNRSSVFTPLAHLAWKLPDSPRDQVRASLTRSYRAPNTNQLIGRQLVNALAPVGDDRQGGNSFDRPDRAGNPLLKPELAWGLELGFEHYLPAGGLLSANLFTRRISDVIRNVVSLQQVAYADVKRYVSRPTNLQSADAAGLELEAKLRAADLWATELPLSLRANLTLMWSRVQGVPGPDNRLEGQPPYTMNLGADLPLRGTPLTVGGNLNHTPGFQLALFDNQLSRQGLKNVVDAYALWKFNPDASARLTVSNALARPYDSGSTALLADGGQQASDTRSRSTTTVNLRAELRF
jgi:outer membrane receptor for ferrienterochelin and colicins